MRNERGHELKETTRSSENELAGILASKCGSMQDVQELSRG